MSMKGEEIMKMLYCIILGEKEYICWKDLLSFLSIDLRN